MKKATLIIVLALVAMLFASCTKENKIEQQIIGKWMTADNNGQPLSTNWKNVYTFVSTTKAYVSASLTGLADAGALWIDQMEADVAIDGNKVTVTFHRDEHHTAVHEYDITNINGSEFTANHKVISTVDGNEEFFFEDVVRFEKVTADYQEAILGKWECTELTGIETYNDANAQLEFFDDGTYNYWRKNEIGEWEAVTNREFQYYFVDGSFLSTRWKNVGEDELREWWEIATIEGNQMHWTALRADSTATATSVQQEMKWVKVD